MGLQTRTMAMATSGLTTMASASRFRCCRMATTMPTSNATISTAGVVIPRKTVAREAKSLPSR